MQNIIIKLQDIIKTHYGFRSELELKPLVSYQTLQKDLYSSVDRSLSIPVLEPKSRKPIAYFKIFDINDSSAELHERLSDLVHVTLQSYIDLIDKLEASDSLVQYLQTELHPQNVIRLQDHKKNKSLSFSPRVEPQATVSDIGVRNSELLILSSSLLVLERLAHAIHETSKNAFFIRTDHMPETFLTSINDLSGLSDTTLFIPRIQKLSPLQQKTLETYLIMTAHKKSSLVIICGTRSSLHQMVHEEGVSAQLIEHLHFFHVLSQSNDNEPLKLEVLTLCALSILGLHSQNDSHLRLQKTKSYHVIPSLKDLYPTVH